MQYRATHEFVRLEALGAYGQNGRANDPADPLALEVRVTSADDVENVIEHGSVGGSSATKPYKLSLGVWGFTLTPGFYEEGKTYTINWRYEMTPGNLKVDRVNFTWSPIPAVPRDSDSCVLFGTVTGVNGLPKTNVIVNIEQYKDFVTLNHRVGTMQAATDAFGNWYAELPRGELFRVLVGQYAKTVKIPMSNNVSLKDVPEYQAADVRKDRFGYPLP